MYIIVLFGVVKFLGTLWLIKYKEKSMMCNVCFASVNNM
jgi:hypothetical protein